MSEERLYLEGRQRLVELSEELHPKCQQSFYSKRKKKLRKFFRICSTGGGAALQELVWVQTYQ